MSEVEVLLVNETENCTIYTIRFLSEDETEYEKFCQAFKDCAEFSADLEKILNFVDLILQTGALERFFRPEGKVKDHVVALPVMQSRLRLYGLRLSDKILILGGGGKKNTQTYEEDNELRGYVLTLQKLDKLLKTLLKTHRIVISEEKLQIDSPLIL